MISKVVSITIISILIIISIFFIKIYTSKTIPTTPIPTIPISTTPIPTTPIVSKIIDPTRDLVGYWYLSINSVDNTSEIFRINYNGIIKVVEEIVPSNKWWKFQYVGKTLDNINIIRFYSTENYSWYGFTNATKYDPQQGTVQLKWTFRPDNAYINMESPYESFSNMKMKRVFLNDSKWYTYDDNIPVPVST